MRGSCHQAERCGAGIPWSSEGGPSGPGGRSRQERRHTGAARPCRRNLRTVATIDDVRAIASTLPRSYEAVVRDRVRFRVGRIVYLGFSRDESLMGFAFPKEERDALVASEPDKFLLPKPSDMRFNWVVARLDAIDEAEMRELVLDAWRMVVPRRVAVAHLGE